MTWIQLLMILITVVSLAVGQVLFKIAVRALSFEPGWHLTTLLQPTLGAAFLMYGFSTLLWLAVLRITPLKVAYPFVGLAFVLVPIFAHFILGEPVGINTFIGTGFILVGIWISVGLG